MKKVLFASTALVLTAGVAAAEVTISGSANMGLKYNGTDTTVHNEIDFDVKGSGETDGGLTFGASIDLDASSDNSANTVGGGASDPEVFISYEGLTVTVGDIGEAQAVGGIADLGYDGIGIDDLVDDIVDSFGSDDVRVDYAFGDIEVAVSADSSTAANTKGVALGVSGSVDAFTFAAGYSDRKGALDIDGDNTVDFTGDYNEATATVGYSAGAFGVTATYSQIDFDGVKVNGYGLHASYTSGDLTVSVAGSRIDADFADAIDGYGVGFAYDLGGATLAGAVGDIDDTTVADLGISFKF